MNLTATATAWAKKRFSGRTVSTWQSFAILGALFAIAYIFVSLLLTAMIAAYGAMGMLGLVLTTIAMVSAFVAVAMWTVKVAVDAGI